MSYENCSEAPLKFAATESDKSITLDLNGHNIVASLNNVKNIALIDIGYGAGQHAKATLIIKDSTESTEKGCMIAKPTQSSDGWTVSVAVVRVQTAGKLILESGKIIMKGKDGGSNSENPYGIDILTNGGASAECEIRGGYVESNSDSGMGIRMFCNGLLNPVILNVSGGEIVGDGRGIWFQNANKNPNKGNLKITGGLVTAKRAVEIGDFNKDVKDDSIVKTIEISNCELRSTSDDGCISYKNEKVVYLRISEYYRQDFENYKIEYTPGITLN